MREARSPASEPATRLLLSFRAMLAPVKVGHDGEPSGGTMAAGGGRRGGRSERPRRPRITRYPYNSSGYDDGRKYSVSFTFDHTSQNGRPYTVSGDSRGGSTTPPGPTAGRK